MGRREVVPEPVAHAGFRLPGPDHQHGHACHRTGYIRWYENDLHRSGACRHQHVEGPQQVAFRANAAHNPDLPQAVNSQPPVVPHVTAFNDAQRPFAEPRASAAPSAGKTLGHVGEVGKGYHMLVISVLYVVVKT